MTGDYVTKKELEEALWAFDGGLQVHTQAMIGEITAVIREGTAKIVRAFETNFESVTEEDLQ